MKKILFAVIAIACTLPFVAAGCDGPADIADACQKQCECWGGPCEKSDQADCLTEAKVAQHTAENANCRAEFEDYITCLTTACIESGSDLKDYCGTEVIALEKCVGGTPVE
jgi:hypothetical protein